MQDASDESRKYVCVSVFYVTWYLARDTKHIMTEGRCGANIDEQCRIWYSSWLAGISVSTLFYPVPLFACIQCSPNNSSQLWLAWFVQCLVDSSMLLPVYLQYQLNKLHSRIVFRIDLEIVLYDSDDSLTLAFYSDDSIFWNIESIGLLWDHEHHLLYS